MLALEQSEEKWHFCDGGTLRSPPGVNSDPPRLWACPDSLAGFKGTFISCANKTAADPSLPSIHLMLLDGVARASINGVTEARSVIRTSTTGEFTLSHSRFQ